MRSIYLTILLMMIVSTVSGASTAGTASMESRESRESRESPATCLGKNSERVMTGEIELDEHDEVWTTVDGLELQVRVYKPAGRNELPMLLDVHGGAWTAYDRTAGELYNRAIARSGFLVAAIDFRDGPEFKHPSASLDVAMGIEWFHENAERLGGDDTRLGLIGSSSGGHLVLYAGVTSKVPLTFIVALWPVSDPFFRYRYAKRAGLNRLVAAHDGYFGSEDAMREASVPRLVTSGETTSLPPTLVIQPGEDSNVPVEMTFDLLRAWQSRGGSVEYSYFPDQPHAFGHRPSAATTEMLSQVIDFAKRRSLE